MGDKIKGAGGTNRDGQYGHILSIPVLFNGEMWFPVQWDGEDKPELYKAKDLLICVEAWEPYIQKREKPNETDN